MTEKIEIDHEDIFNKNLTGEKRSALFSVFFKFLGEVAEATNNIEVLGKGQSKHKGLVEGNKEKINLVSLDFLSSFYDGRRVILPMDREEKDIQPVAGMLRYVKTKS